jgi:hypothetical protein
MVAVSKANGVILVSKWIENRGVKIGQKHRALAFSIVVMLLAFVGAASAETWHVDDDLHDYPDADFTDIQDAINAASSPQTMRSRKPR